MSHTIKLIAVDIGASGGRCSLATFDGEKITLEIIHRFPNGPIEVMGHWFWDVLSLYQGIKEGLIRTARLCRNDLRSIAIDTWGVDFALLDSQGKLVSNPYCARDPQTRGVYAEIFKLIDKRELFYQTGVQFMEINSIVQLMAMRLNQDPAYLSAATFLTIPDLINYWMTGIKACEYTNATTTQLFNTQTNNWAFPVIQKLGFPETLFPEVIPPGTLLGNIRPVLAEEVGLHDVAVIATATHDTAAAVAAVPAQQPGFGYISSGTWALLGRELNQPLLSDRVLEYNFANEGGVFGTITFLKNILSMWFLQELQRVWRVREREYSWQELTDMAMEAQPFQSFIDPDHPDFIPPGDMPAKIQQACADTGQRIPQTKGEIVRTALESLACKYRMVNDRATRLVGRPAPMMHIVGGGSQNRLLNQFTANILNTLVIAGPAEATTLGNILIQMQALGLIHSLEEGRDLIRRSVQTEEFLPQEIDRWEEAYQKFLSVVGSPALK
jgi:sugar (pentulose or hexulose) kinase